MMMRLLHTIIPCLAASLLAAQGTVVDKNTPASSLPTEEVIVIEVMATPVLPGMGPSMGAPKQIITDPSAAPTPLRAEVIEITVDGILLPHGEAPTGAVKEVIGDGESSRPGEVIILPPVDAIPLPFRPPAPPLYNSPE